MKRDTVDPELTAYDEKTWSINKMIRATHHNASSDQYKYLGRSKAHFNRTTNKKHGVT